MHCTASSVGSMLYLGLAARKSLFWMVQAQLLHSHKQLIRGFWSV